MEKRTDLRDDNQLEQYLIRQFEWFHRHPELSYEEVRTTERIRNILTDAGIEILPCVLDTGLVAVVRGEKEPQDLPKSSDGESPCRTIALRCDIDALPVTETADVLYRSQEEGKMHACGHDFHITAGIGAAICLERHKREFCGTVKFIFQPAEEDAHGALKVIETGIAHDLACIWGFHGDPTNETGVIGIREGYVTAAVDRFMIYVQGAGCHGAHPDDGIDPILAASAIVQGLQSIPGRNVNAFHPSLISVTRMQAGTTWNVIPADAEMEGTVRTMDREDRILYERRVREIAELTARAYGAQASAEWIAGPPATYNDDRMAQAAKEIAERAGFRTVPEESSMGGDDFAYYEDEDTMGRRIPGCYVKIGIGKGHPIHHPSFRVEERVILPASRYLAEVLQSTFDWL